MAFPWNRGDAQDQIAPAQARRRARGRRARQEEAQTERTNLTSDQRHQRVAWGVGAGLLVLVLGVVVFGFYNEFYKPPRVWAGSVGEVEFTMGDLVERIRVLQGLSGQVDLSTIPFEYLRDLLNAQILRRAAPGLGISVTDEDIEEGLKAQFYPPTVEGQTTDPGQLDEEYRNNYQIFLARTGLTDEDFRVIMGEELARFQLRSLFGLGIEDVQEQVEVAWIRLQITGDVDSTAVRDRLETEDFAKVAGEVGNPARYADGSGYVGWVPKGAFPELDSLLFEDIEGDQPTLKEGEISQPAFTTDGIYIVRKISGPTDQEISEPMRAKLNNELVLKWQNEQQLIGSNEGWLKMNFNSKWYAWVGDQVKLSAPTGGFAEGNPQGRR